MLCLSSVLTHSSKELFKSARANCESALFKGITDENLPVQAAAVGGIAALALACLRHGEDATQPISQMAEMLGAGVSEIRTAALAGAMNMGKQLVSH